MVLERSKFASVYRHSLVLLAVNIATVHVPCSLLAYHGEVVAGIRAVRLNCMCLTLSV